MSFLVNLFKKQTKKINLTICGLDNAGKTTIINYLIKGEFQKQIPTMGINREVIDLPKLQMNVFDLGGQVDFRPMWASVNEQSNALIYVIDSTDQFRMEESKKIFYEIIETQINEKIPILILLNKVDLPNRISREKFIEIFELGNPRLQMEWACYETSAFTGEGIYESFNWFINTLQEV
ncbi:MAG: GTP-binding protein [Candidatus Heimdallarchaeota archaeon]|nr:GTP-binding protein [Candidatus Heimdallarchaeota archaeon]